MAELHEILDQQFVSLARDALDELYQTGSMSTADLATFEKSLGDLLAENGTLEGNQIESVVSALSSEISANYDANPGAFITRTLYPDPDRYLHAESGLYYDDSGNWYDADGAPSAYAWSADDGLFYDAAGNWYNADLTPHEVAEPLAEDEPIPQTSGEPGRYVHAESGLYYDDGGNWYDADGAPSAYAWSADDGLFYDAAGNWYNADLSPYQAAELLAEGESGAVLAVPMSEEGVTESSDDVLPQDMAEALSELIDEVLEQVAGAADLSSEELAEILEEALRSEAEG